MRKIIFVNIICVLTFCSGLFSKEIVAQKPPLGWNSFDAFYSTVTEQEVKDNAFYLFKKIARTLRMGVHCSRLLLELPSAGPSRQSTAIARVCTRFGDGRIQPVNACSQAFSICLRW
jgi:hypothetical protein